MKSEKKEPKKRRLEFVLLTDEERRKLEERFGGDGAADWIEQLNNYLGSIKNKNKYDSHYHTILVWAGKKAGAARAPGNAAAADLFIEALKAHATMPELAPRIRAAAWEVLRKRRVNWPLLRQRLLDDPPIGEQLRKEFLAEFNRTA